MKLTFEQLKLRASKHPTRSQLAKHDESAYESAKRQGLLDTLYPNPQAIPSRLTDEIITARAKQCSTRNEFKLKHDTAWRAAIKRGLIDQLFPRKHPPKPPKLEPWQRVAKPKPLRVLRKITHDFVRDVASRYASRSAFDNADATCAQYARKHGLMDELFPGPIRYATNTTEGFITKARAIHGDRYDYSEVKYYRANEKVKIICPIHGAFWQRPTSHYDGRGCAKCWAFDNNAFYLKRADTCYFNGNPVFKVGVTSTRLGDARLKQQERMSKMSHTPIINPTEVVGFATDIEGYALSLGENPGYIGFDGCSEYRAYSDADLQAIKAMVELCAGEHTAPAVTPKFRKKPFIRGPHATAEERVAAVGLVAAGLPMKEVAERVGVKYGTLASWVVRAKQ